MKNIYHVTCLLKNWVWFIKALIQVVHPIPLHSHLMQHLLPWRVLYILYVQNDPIRSRLDPRAPVHNTACMKTCNISKNFDEKFSEPHLAENKWITCFIDHELVQIEENIKNMPWKFTWLQIFQCKEWLILPKNNKIMKHKKYCIEKIM